MKPFSGIGAVTLDVGGTLIDPWPSVGDVYAAVAREIGLPAYEPHLLNARFAAAWRGKELFDYSREGWANLVVNTFNGSPDQFGSGSVFFERLYARFVQPQVWRIHPDVRPALQALLDAGLRLAVISNWDERLRPLLHRLELDSFFDAIVVSHEQGCHKPASRIFLTAVQALGLLPHQVLHVGDSTREDFEGAKRAGLQAVLVRRGAAGQGSGEIRSLGELMGLVRGAEG